MDIAFGLAYLHSWHIVHLDLNAGNILLARNMSAKISEFGLARVLLKDLECHISDPGNFDYAAPEVLIRDMKVQLP
jgi:serine/threonine protein kinase